MSTTAPVAHSSHHLPQVKLIAFVLAALTVVVLAVFLFTLWTVSNDDGLIRVSPRDAGHDPDFANAIRTDAHAAPHVDLPPDVFVFTDWSPTGSTVYTVQPDGTGLSKMGTSPPFARPVLLAGGSRVNFEPGSPSAWAPLTLLSPDGWRLATFDQHGLHIANGDGSGSRLLSPNAQVPTMSRIAWDPDSRHLFVWEGNGGGTYAAVRLDVDDGTLDPLPREASRATSISPAGDRIAYAVGKAIRIARVDGSDAVDVNVGFEVSPHFDPYLIRAIAWSPDGERLAFPYGKGFAIAAMDGSLTVPTPAAASTTIDRAECLAWSPDGRYLGLSGGRDAAEQSHVLVFDTSNLSSEPVVIDAGLVRTMGGVPVVWWDDGRGLFFVGRGQYVGEGIGHEAIYSVSLDGKTDIRLSGDVNVGSMVGMTH